MTSETRYAKSGDVHIAYQVVGDGPIDIVFVPGWITHLELAWEDPLEAAFLRRLASFSRLIVFDKRGTGLSDRVPVNELPILEERMDDVRAVMDAAGSERAALLGVSEGGPLSSLFAATYPERTAALVLYGAFARTGSGLMTQESSMLAWTRSSVTGLTRSTPPSRLPVLPLTRTTAGAGARSCGTRRARAPRLPCCG
jgi:pimeloyl-ACP methyl ester carboxylesterase